MCEWDKGSCCFYDAEWHNNYLAFVCLTLHGASLSDYVTRLSFLVIYLGYHAFHVSFRINTSEITKVHEITSSTILLVLQSINHSFLLFLSIRKNPNRTHAFLTRSNRNQPLSVVGLHYSVVKLLFFLKWRCIGVRGQLGEQKHVVRVAGHGGRVLLQAEVALVHQTSHWGLWLWKRGFWCVHVRVQVVGVPLWLEIDVNVDEILRLSNLVHCGINW